MGTNSDWSLGKARCFGVHLANYAQMLEHSCSWSRSSTALHDDPPENMGLPNSFVPSDIRQKPPRERKKKTSRRLKGIDMSQELLWFADSGHRSLYSIAVETLRSSQYVATLHIHVISIEYRHCHRCSLRLELGDMNWDDKKMTMSLVRNNERAPGFANDVTKR